MIPRNIERSHVLRALEYIDKYGIPKGRGSKKFQLRYGGVDYPPKFVISLANEFANDVILSPDSFGGGQETNDFLKALGFEIIDEGPSEIVAPRREPRMRRKMSTEYHDERCPECKIRIHQLLTAIYGKVLPNHKLDAVVRPEDIKDPDLMAIYGALVGYRGYDDFVKARTLPNCDYYLPEQKILVEFDESQHFTYPRKLTLERYPDTLDLGFDKDRWIALCEHLDKHDNDPPYRDEQRAWYDTIRDFLSKTGIIKRVVRLYANDMPWCKLDPNDQFDRDTFKAHIEGTNALVQVRQEPEPFFGRIILAGAWQGNIQEARGVVKKVCDNWPDGKRVPFLLTCGGFLQFEWPGLTRRQIGDNKEPDAGALEQLFSEARECVQAFLTQDIKRRLSEHVRYISLGVDSHKEKISTTQNHISHLHTEMVCLYDLDTKKEYWTGKSYPTTAQEKGLVRIKDLGSHIVNVPTYGKVLLMGCHDLSIFSPRSVNAKGWRERINAEFTGLVKKERPAIVLHHPHTADSSRTWGQQWGELERDVPSVRWYAGAGRYHNADKKQRTPLDILLRSTKKGSSVDFIIIGKN